MSVTGQRSAIVAQSKCSSYGLGAGERSSLQYNGSFGLRIPTEDAWVYERSTLPYQSPRYWVNSLYHTIFPKGRKCEML